MIYKTTGMIKLNNKNKWLTGIIALFLWNGAIAQEPVNPNATNEVRELLKYLYQQTGKGIISGNHNIQDDPTHWDEKLLDRNGGVEPAIYGNDFRYGGHIEHRQKWIDEAINQWKNKGKIITIMYHQARPMDEEAEATFSGSVQGQVSWAEMEALLTDGDPVHEMWEVKMDTIAYFLQQLEDENIPVLFRPYHEMNGGWFWWGGKGNQYKKLYRMTYDYLTHEKGLNNILWVLNYSFVDEDFDSYYPGDNYVDAFATDIYDAKFETEHYIKLRDFAKGKPIGIGEVGEMISVERLKNDFPDYVWFMGWRDLFVDKMLRSELATLFNHSWVINDYKELVSNQENTATGELFVVARGKAGKSQLIINQPLNDSSTLYIHTIEGTRITCNTLKKGTKFYYLDLKPGVYLITLITQGKRSTVSTVITD